MGPRRSPTAGSTSGDVRGVTIGPASSLLLAGRSGEIDAKESPTPGRIPCSPREHSRLNYYQPRRRATQWHRHPRLWPNSFAGPHRPRGARTAKHADRDRHAVAVRFVLAAAPFAASAAFALAADVPPSVQRSWYDDGPWSVAGFAFADGNKDCVLANTRPTSNGKSAFVLSDFGGRGSNIIFRDTTINWNASDESIGFTIDGNPSFTTQAQTDTRHNTLVVVLNNTSSTIMDAFMNELESGRVLLVTPSAGTPRAFALDGVNPALEAFGRCIAAMSSDRKRPS